MNIGLIEFAQQEQKKKTPGLIGAGVAGAVGAYGTGIASAVGPVKRVANKMQKQGITPTSQDLKGKFMNPDGSLNKLGKKVNKRVNIGMGIGAAAGIGAQQYFHRRKQRKQGRV